jgi:hypothetical protein
LRELGMLGKWPQAGIMIECGYSHLLQADNRCFDFEEKVLGEKNWITDKIICFSATVPVGVYAWCFTIDAVMFISGICRRKINKTKPKKFYF